jgi:lipopolysaccharide heptosyltransferase I
MRSRLLIVRLGSLGDLIHTLPAVSAIRRAHPDVEIDWLVDAVHRDLLDLVPILTRVITLDRPSVAGWLQARAALRARGYAAAVDFQGLVKSAALAWLSGARRTVGFERTALREPIAAWFYTERVAADDSRHVIEKNLQLAAAMGADTSRFDFPLATVESPVLDALRASGLAAFALLNCGAAWPNKRWPADRFGRVAAWLRERHGLASVVLWGPGEDALAAEVARASGGAAMAAPRTSLRDLLALARAARLMVSGDTGPTHIAAAVGTPIVAVFGPTSPSRNGPWLPADVEISRYDRCDCHYERRCRREPAAWCLGTIGEDEVRAAIDERLAR